MSSDLNDHAINSASDSAGAHRAQLKTPRFLSLEEEIALSQRQCGRNEGKDLGIEGDAFLDSLVPYTSIPISNGCYDLIMRVGPRIRQVMNFPYEFYMEGFSVMNDPILRNVFLPSQDRVSNLFFEVSHKAQQECVAYLRSLRKQTKLDWITIASIHGHGNSNIKVGKDAGYGSGSYIAFSPRDVAEHIKHFLETQSLPTRRALDITSEVCLMFNDWSVRFGDNGLEIYDGFVYHPIFSIKDVSRDGQAELLQSLGINPYALNGRSTLEIVAAHLQKAAAEAEQMQEYAISATQYKIRRHNYFIVVDNAGNNHAEIGILVEDAVSQRCVSHRKKVNLEVVKTDDDIVVSDSELTAMVEMAFEGIRQQQKAMIPKGFATWTIPPELKEKEINYTKLLDATETKDLSGVPTDIEITSRFYHTALAYLDMARHPDYKYSSILSAILKSSVLAHRFPYFTLSFAVGVIVNHGTEGIHEDTNPFYINTNLDNFKEVIVENLVRYMHASPHKEIEHAFVREFAFAPTVYEQNRVLERYVPLLAQADAILTDRRKD